MNRSVLSEKERKAVLDLPAFPMHAKGNEDFVTLGQHVDHASLIVSGLAGSFCQTRDGSRQIVALHIPGEMADLQSVVQPQAKNALQALSPTMVLRIPHWALRDAARTFPALAEAFWRDCSADATILAQWVMNVGRRDALERIAHLICEMTCRLEAQGEIDEPLDAFTITQVHLSEATGLSAVHVNRILQWLRRNRIAEFREKRLHLLDWDRLVRVADFDSAYLHLANEPGDRLRIAQA